MLGSPPTLPSRPVWAVNEIPGLLGNSRSLEREEEAGQRGWRGVGGVSTFPSVMGLGGKSPGDISEPVLSLTFLGRQSLLQRTFNSSPAENTNSLPGGIRVFPPSTDEIPLVQ